MSYERYIEILDLWCDIVCIDNNRARQVDLIVSNNPISKDEVIEFFAYKDVRDTLNKLNNKEG